MVTSLNNTMPARDFGYGGTVQVLGGRVTPPGTAAVTTYSVKLGMIPAGSVILLVNTNIETLLNGSATLNVGTASGGAQIVAAIAAAAGSANNVPIAAFVQPVAADTEIWGNILAGTAPMTGDAYVYVLYVKPAT